MAIDDLSTGWTARVIRRLPGWRRRRSRSWRGCRSRCGSWRWSRRRRRRRHGAGHSKTPNWTIRRLVRHRLACDTPVIRNSTLQTRNEIRLRTIRSQRTRHHISRNPGQAARICSEINIVLVRPTSSFPLQHYRRPGRRTVPRREVDRHTRRQRRKWLVLRRRIPLPIKLIDKPLEEPRFVREVVVLFLIVERLPAPIRRTEDRQPAPVQRHRLLMVQPAMLAHLDLHTGRIHSIDVVWSGEFGAQSARIETIFIWLRQQPDRYPARNRAQQRIDDADVSHSIHRQIDLLVFAIELRHHSRAVIFGHVLVRHEIHRRIDRQRRIIARKRSVDVRVVSVEDGVRPDIVEPGLETVHHRRVIREIPRAVNVVIKRHIRRDVRIAEVRTGEKHLVLTREQRQLHVHDAVAEFVTQRNTGSIQLVNQRLVLRKLQIRARLDDDTHADACLVSGDDVVDQTRQLDHVKSHVDTDGFRLHPLAYQPVTVFE